MVTLQPFERSRQSPDCGSSAPSGPRMPEGSGLEHFQPGWKLKAFWSPDPNWLDMLKLSSILDDDKIILNNNYSL